MKIILICIALFFFVAESEAQVSLIKDINREQTVHTSHPRDFIEMNGNAYFIADDLLHGSELWKTDGTGTGTCLVKDIKPGADSSIIKSLTVCNNKLYFVADDGAHGRELWQSDGTDSGTVMVADIQPGIINSSVGNLTEYNNSLYFTAKSDSMWKVYRLDSTFSSAVVLYERNYFLYGNYIGNLNVMGGYLFFVGYLPNHGVTLYKTDGTIGGTIPIADALQNTAVVEMKPLFNKLIFRSYNGTDDLYISSPFANYCSVVNVHNPATLVATDSLVFFLGTSTSSSTEKHIWKSDGTVGGTQLVYDNTSINENISSLFPYNGKVYFSATDGVHGNELWVSDGTSAGTYMLKDLCNITSEGAPRYFVENNGLLYFSARSNNLGYTIWVTDGDSANTFMVASIDSLESTYPINFGSAIGNLFFCFDGELWKTDGTAAGTVLVKDIIRKSGDSNIESFASLNDTVYFSADDGINGQELWKSDGTEAGTVLVSDIYTGISDANPSYITPMGNYFFFSARFPSFNNALFVSDGSPSGTRMVATYNNSTNLTVFNNELIFASESTGLTGVEVCVSDCTQTGTYLVADIYSGIGDSYPSNFVEFDHKLFFNARTNTTGYELYSMDTSHNVSLFSDIYAGSSNSNPILSSNAVLDSVMLFVATAATSGTSLYRTNGLVSGTYSLGAVNPSVFASFKCTRLNNDILMSASSTGNGYELIKSDGTVGGTVLVKDINAGTGNSYPDNLTNMLGWVYFSADDGMNGKELWKTDGTALGTQMVSDIWPGTGSSEPSDFIIIDSVLYFVANDGTNGREIWRTDGTSGGTFLAGEVFLGSGDGSIGAVSSNSTCLYFGASNDTSGIELFKYDPLYTTIIIPPKSTYCAGDNFTVFFKTWGTYFPGNYFIAELSDTSGSFSNPTILDSLNGTVSGMISTHIPKSLLTGNQYKVRVRTTNPASYYGTNSDNIVIHESPQVSVFADPTELCENWNPVYYYGIPSGGVYSGDTSANNLFDPALSGTGSFQISYYYTDSYGCSNSDSITFVVSDCSGIGEKDDSVYIYPVPASEIINIECNIKDYAQFEIVDLEGSVIKTGKLNQSGENQISLNGIPDGVYIFKAYDSETTLYRKIVISH